MLTVAAVILFVALAVLVHMRQWQLSARLERLITDELRWDWRLLGVSAGVMLLINAGTGVFLAHNLPLTQPVLHKVAMLLQAVIGLLLLAQLSYRWAGYLTVLGAVVALVTVPLNLLLDYVVEFLGLAATLICIAPRVGRFDHGGDRYTQFALPCLRVTVGLSLVILAIHNKLSAPGLGMAFLAEYAFNFMPALGFTNFSDLNFVLAAGLFEFAFGLLIAFGIATRFVTAVVSVFFVLTLLALGLTELIGHLPLIAAAIILVLRGGGKAASTCGPAVSSATV
jgi:uncharacterized membrane protein YphA (DoxX/SURF4 family)